MGLVVRTLAKVGHRIAERLEWMIIDLMVSLSKVTGRVLFG